MTIDRSDRKAGGDILMAVPAGDAASFARKYGTDFEGRNDSDSLKGTFLSVARAGGHENSQIWIIDTTGKLAKAIAEKKLSLPADGKLAEGGARASTPPESVIKCADGFGHRRDFLFP